MEGVIDPPMRQFLSERGGFDYCVSEFVRVSRLAPPAHVFHRQVPELGQGARTASGMEVQLQLLGGEPERMAEAALIACRAGATGIDLNFGCPAPTVNRHDGGASLLRFPRRIREIVEAVRRAVPATLPVSAKLRLGWDSIEEIHLNAEMAAQGGASWLTIHGRTKVQGYAPPAHWKPIGQVRRNLGLPIVANGEIWTLEDFRRCREDSGCEHFMLGRGALADLSLVHRIRVELGLEARAIEPDEHSWPSAIRRFAEVMHERRQSPARTLRRVKQWMGLAGSKGGGNQALFQAIKRAASLEELLGFFGP